jgi:hypothetical protein
MIEKPALGFDPGVVTGFGEDHPQSKRPKTVDAGAAADAG